MKTYLNSDNGLLKPQLKVPHSEFLHSCRNSHTLVIAFNKACNMPYVLNIEDKIAKGMSSILALWGRCPRLYMIT